MKKIYNIKISTIIMVLLPILSILIGYFGVKLYLLSNNNYNDAIDNNRPGVEEIIESVDSNTDEGSVETEDSDDNQINNDNNSEKRMTNRINGINYYSIQVGSFSNEDNAIEFRDQFSEQGLFSYYLKSNNYKVYVSASYNKENLEEGLETVKETSPDAFIKNVNLDSKNFSYVIKEKDHFESISELIATQLNGINGTVSTSKINDTLEALEKKNNEFVEVDEVNQSIGTQVTNYVTGVKNELTILDSEDEKTIQKFLEKNISLFIKYFR